MAGLFLEEHEHNITWDFLISERIRVIPVLAEKLGVKEDYISYNLEFYRAVQFNKKEQALRSLNQAEKRINELS